MTKQEIYRDLCIEAGTLSKTYAVWYSTYSSNDTALKSGFRTLEAAEIWADELRAGGHGISTDNIKSINVDDDTIDADDWYADCSHNIDADLDETLELAATGDVVAIAEARRQCGLPALV